MHAIDSPINESLAAGSGIVPVSDMFKPDGSNGSSSLVTDVRAIAMAAANFDRGLSRDHDLTRATRSGSGESNRAGSGTSGHANETTDTMLVQSHCTTGGKAVATAFNDTEKANAAAAAAAKDILQENMSPNTKQEMRYNNQASLSKSKPGMTRAQQLTTGSDDDSFLSTRSSFGAKSSPRATPPPGIYRRLQRENDLLQMELKAAEEQVGKLSCANSLAHSLAHSRAVRKLSSILSCTLSVTPRSLLTYLFDRCLNNVGRSISSR
jgi:hypothetical protein